MAKTAVLISLLHAMKSGRKDLSFSLECGFEFFKEDYNTPNSKDEELDPLSSFSAKNS